MGVGMPEYVLLFRKPQTDKTRSYSDQPVRKNKADYSRGQWQIDAHQLWRSDGKNLHDEKVAQAMDELALNPEKLAGMDTGAIYKWYVSWSKRAPYDYEQHVGFNEALGDRLPAKFMLMPPQAPEGYEDSVWTDILFFRTLNMNNARRRIEKHVCPLPLDIVKRLINRFSRKDELIFDPFGGLQTVPYLAVKMGRRGRGHELNPTYFKAGADYCQQAEQERSAPSLFDLMAQDAGQVSSLEVAEAEALEMALA